MKHLSIKARLTLIYGILMSIFMILSVTLLLSLSSKSILRTTQEKLEMKMKHVIDEITYEDNHYVFDKDLLSLDDGVYISIYDKSDKAFLYGRLPYDFDHVDFLVNTLRREDIQSTQQSFYVYDHQYQLSHGKPLLIRGVISISEAYTNLNYIVHITMILIPLLILINSLLGYLLAKKALSPVSYITNRVKEIIKQKDTSQRVHLGDGKDEIYKMADTFDHLLSQNEANLKREIQFTNDVSHELRTPLTTILMQCDNLLENDIKTNEDILLIKQKAQSMHTIISQLLLLSRADMGKANLCMEELNLSELCELAIEEASMLAKAKDITFTSTITANLMILGDQTLLIRFFMNLFNNAITYGKQNGHIHVSLQQQNDDILIQIQDDGIGISKEQLPYIWNRFYRCDPSHHSTTNNGLGLSMVKWIVEAHHGKCDVTSELDVGTTFQFTFPLLKKDTLF